MKAIYVQNQEAYQDSNDKIQRNSSKSTSLWNSWKTEKNYALKSWEKNFTDSPLAMNFSRKQNDEID